MCPNKKLTYQHLSITQTTRLCSDVHVVVQVTLKICALLNFRLTMYLLLGHSCIKILVRGDFKIALNVVGLIVGWWLKKEVKRKNRNLEDVVGREEIAQRNVYKWN